LEQLIADNESKINKLDKHLFPESKDQLEEVLDKVGLLP
jgi:hypothetical protein